MKQNIEWTLKLYSLTIAIPLTFSVLNIFLCGIFGIETEFGFWMNFKVIWIDYYFTGSFLDISAWRWQIGLLFLSFFFTIFSD